MAGFIRLSRKYFEHNLWNEVRIFSPAEAWLDLIASARFESEPEKLLIRMKMIKINRGELRASTRFLARRWSWSKDKVSRFLKLLVEDTMISREMRHGESIITILNYNKFNPISLDSCDNGKDTSNDTNKDKGETDTRTATSQQQGQTKEREEYKERKESLYRQKFFQVLEIFYFRNFNRPINVTNHFYRHYEAINWVNGQRVEITNIEAVAGNWENKITEGVNCPANLLIRWENIYNFFKSQKLTVGETEIHKLLLAVRPAILENGKLRLRGKKAVLNMIADNDSLQKMLLQQFKTHYEVREFEIEPDKIEEEATLISKER
jgi:hypothetical protein